MKQSNNKHLVLSFIFLLAIFFRFYNLNWDSNFHLHPDERFLTMVGNAMKIPDSISTYLDTKTSTMNPVNIGHKFFVYGLFPTTLTKILALVFDMDTYNGFTMMGRMLSAFFDVLTLLFVYKIAELLVHRYKLDEKIPYWAAFFYAIAVLPIQLSHFFAVDTFLTFFMLGSYYYTLRFSFITRHSGDPPAGGESRISRGSWSSQDDGVDDLIRSAVMFGLAMACKLTAVFILPLILVVIGARVVTKGNRGNKEDVGKLIIYYLLFIVISYLVLRFASPYYFESGNVFDITFSKTLVQNIKMLKAFDSPDVWYPPGLQWIHKTPVVFSLINMAVFGVGVPYFILIILGLLSVILNPSMKLRVNSVKDLVSRRSFTRFLSLKSEGRNDIVKPILFISALWVVGFFIYQSTQFVKAMRYFIFLYPFFAIFAGIGINELINVIARRERSERRSNLILLARLLHFVRNDKVYIVLIVILLIWPFMFLFIYSHKNTRVDASEWIYQNLPAGSYILSEYWDDSLPMPYVDTKGKRFNGEQLHVFDPDTPAKWDLMNKALQKADYYILSSNRGWGSIPTVPEKYPLTTKFYQELFAEKRGYKKIKEFTSYPKFSIFNFQFSISDDFADESFTVYDHPKVLIYQRI